LDEKFQRFTRKIEHAVGSPWAFLAALISVVVWAGFGPFYNFSDTWQLVCNTGSTIVTYLLVFIIQATQTNDTKAIHAKLDELIRVTDAARNEIMLAEDISPAELDLLKEQLHREAK
jgi:low affinity Fe/Cu permease